MDFIRLILPLLAPWPLWGGRKKLSVQWASMTSVQKQWLMFAYDCGAPHQLGESLRAICWQESSAGSDLEHESDGSFGLFGNKALIVATRHYETWPGDPTKKQVATMRRRLINEPVFAAIACVDELEYWQGKRGEDRWTKVWASYNAGWKWRNGLDYARDIMAKVKFLRTVTKEDGSWIE